MLAVSLLLCLLHTYFNVPQACRFYRFYCFLPFSFQLASLLLELHGFRRIFTAVYENRKRKTYFIHPKKTGVQISSFFLLPSDSLFAGMSGVPSRPIMTISQALYDSFSEEELEYIVLHETAHYALWHPLTEILLQLGIVMTTYFVLRSISISPQNKIFLAVCAGCIFGILFIHVVQQFERQADTYALERLENPQAMIAATYKLQSAWKGPADDTLTRKLFYRGRPYAERVKHAENFVQ